MILEKAFNLQTFINSETAKKLGIDNNPTDEHFVNLNKLHKMLVEVQERLCVKYAKPIQLNITSGYRSEALNKAVGGSKTSQHSQGMASDTTALGVAINDYFEALKELAKAGTIKFGQVILEKVKGKEWVHISLPTERLVNDFKTTNDGKNYIKVKL